MRNAFGGNLLRSRHGLWRFLREMNSPSQVVVPTPGNFSIYRVVDDGPNLISELTDADLAGLTTSKSQPVQRGDDGFLYVNGRKIDLGFFRKVELEAGPLSRNDYADRALTARMKALQVNLNISDLESSITKSLTAFKACIPLSLHSQIMGQIPKRMLKLIYDTLTPGKFESLLQWYFERIGASKVDIPPRREAEKEGDADVIAIFEPLKTIYYIQAKFHRSDGTTSSWAVNQITEYVQNISVQEDDGYAKVPWVVSTCDDFSPNCQQMAKKNHVILINGQEFARMLIEAGISGLDM